MAKLAIVTLLLCFLAVAYCKRESVPIEGRYIFVFNSNLTLSERENYIASFLEAHPDHKIRLRYDIGDFHGFSAEASPSFVLKQHQNPMIASVENDYTVHVDYVSAPLAECKTQSGATWGIDRISERELSLDGDFEYEHDGTPVDAYIIDTGIYTSHDEMRPRAVWGATFTGDGNDNDCNGHGTHVAGTVGGTIYGVAKKVSLIAVKVLNCGGSGTYEGVVAGVNWVAAEFQRKRKPSVANMSLGGGRHAGLNAAVDAAVRAGVNFVVAAGNSNADACNFSPASALSAITVGATDVGANGEEEVDIRASYSNHGTCLDQFAPGSLITSAWIGRPNAIHTISGTSMASPHVAGAVCAYLEKHPTHNPTQVDQALKDISTKNIIQLNCGSSTVCLQSPNRLLFSGCEEN